MLIFKISLGKKDTLRRRNFAKTENCKKTEQQKSETEKSGMKDNGELRKFIDLRPFRVVTIVPLKSLQSDSRESGRVLEIRVQPSGKRQDSSSCPDSRIRKGLEREL